MRTFLLGCLIGIIALFSVPQTSLAVVSVKGASVTVAHASVAIGNKATHTYKRPSKFKMWVLKTMAKASGGDSNDVLAIVLCLFLGEFGIHRVVLGSKPIIILWYILTLGGIFGLIPLIDFFRMIFQGTSHYQGNNSLFACFE